jgi:hypothetical protein
MKNWITRLLIPTTSLFSSRSNSTSHSSLFLEAILKALKRWDAKWVASSGSRSWSGKTSLLVIYRLLATLPLIRRGWWVYLSRKGKSMNITF